jgi:hypothetical protein
MALMRGKVTVRSPRRRVITPVLMTLVAEPEKTTVGVDHPDPLEVGLELPLVPAGDSLADAALGLGEAATLDAVADSGALTGDLTDSCHRSGPGKEGEEV